MFGGMESASVALVMARRESVPASNGHRPKSPLGKTYSMPPTAGVRKSLSLSFTLFALISITGFHTIDLLHYYIRHRRNALLIAFGVEIVWDNQ